MRKLFLAFLTIISFSVSAQSNTTAVEDADSLTTAARLISIPKTEWLSPFSKVIVDGPMNITFKKVKTDEELKIVYDTKNNPSSRFRRSGVG